MSAPDWKALRAEFPVFEHWAYLGWASVASLPRPVAMAMREQILGVELDGVSRFPEWYADATSARVEAAKLINAHSDEISLLKNTGEGLNTIANGLDLKPGDNVVVPHGEFPANAYPWIALKDKGIELRRVPIDTYGRFSVQDVEKLIDSRTRVLSLSWVNFSTGFRLDLAAFSQLCKSRNVFYCVDAIQGLGVFPLDVKAISIDSLSADGHKWICGPEGQAMFYLKKELLEKVRPLAQGWHSVAQPGLFERDDQPLAQTGKRFECGTMPGVTVAGFAAALKLILRADPVHIQQRIFELSATLCTALTRRGIKPHLPIEIFDPTKPNDTSSLKNWSGIITFDLPGKDVKAIARDLEKQKILINPRNGRLRISLHAWNNENDIERVLKAL